MYDEEQAIKDFIDLFKTSFNASIDCVNTSKGAILGDPDYIPNIPTDKYVSATLGIKKLLNYKGFFISYGIEDTPIRAQNENNYVEDFNIMVEVCTFDYGNLDSDILFRQLMRYRKAMKNLVMKNTDIFRGYAKPLVGSLKPAAFPYSNNVVILSIGIVVKASFTAN